MIQSDERKPTLRRANIPFFAIDELAFWPDEVISAAAAHIQRAEDARFLNITLPQTLHQLRTCANKRKKRARARTGRR